MKVLTMLLGIAGVLLIGLGIMFGNLCALGVGVFVATLALMYDEDKEGI